VRLPLATLQDLQDELAWVGEALQRMDSAVVTNQERAENRRQSLLEHQADVLAQIAEKEQA
jgi:hypothetical protein